MKEAEGSAGSSPRSHLHTLTPSYLTPDLVAERIRWSAWEEVIARQGITIDRPRHSRHPRFEEIVYPLDYGYVKGTLGTDGDGLDVFVGTAEHGLVGLILTTDHRQGDREAKLLYRCRADEVYLAHGFINFDQRLLEGTLVLRHPLHTLWRPAGAPVKR